MAENVSFKVYLRDPSQGEEAEVRRFVVAKAVSANLVAVKEKLVAVFPVLKERVFSVSWTDEDGDMITIDSDEELALAMAELPGPVYKLTATVKDGKQEQPREVEVSLAGFVICFTTEVAKAFSTIVQCRIVPTSPDILLIHCTVRTGLKAGGSVF